MKRTQKIKITSKMKIPSTMKTISKMKLTSKMKTTSLYIKPDMKEMKPTQSVRLMPN